MIPKIANFVWLDSPLPDWARRNIESFAKHNDDYEIRVHFDEELIAEKYKPLAAKSPRPVTRSDFVRYSILQAEGGVYFDTDIYHFRPLLDLADVGGRIACVNIIEGVPCICGMAAAPGAAGWRAIDEYLFEHQPLRLIYSESTTAIIAAARAAPENYCPLPGEWTIGRREDFYLYAKIHELPVGDIEARDAAEPGGLTGVHLGAGGAWEMIPRRLADAEFCVKSYRPKDDRQPIRRATSAAARRSSSA